MPLLLGEIVRRQARHRGDKVAYVLGDHRVTYTRLNAQVNRLANALRGLGVRHGDRVATLAPNRVEYPVVYFALAKLGAIHVPVNFRYQAAELRYALAQSESSVMLVDGGWRAMVEDVRSHLPALRHVVALDGDASDAAPALMAAASDAEPAPEPSLDEHDPHVMLYTSGTTGDPKGALLSHRSYALQARQTQGTVGLGEDAVGLCMFPMFHMGGWAMPLGYWANGGTVVILEKAEPDAILRSVAHERVTYLYLLPLLWDAVMASPDFERTDRSSLHALGAGTQAMSREQVETIVARFRNENLYVMYGQTEAGPVCALRPPETLQKPTSVGRPVLNVDVEVRDPGGRPVPPGETGEIVCRSDFTMLGYWRMPEATAETVRDGWVHTGDLARVDDDGVVFIAGRVKELIKCGGENIFPAEVERCLLEHPGIAEAAVFGVPDDGWGELPIAAVVARPGARLAEDEVIAHVRARLAGYKKPRRVWFRDTLPRTASTRQIQKAALRAEWLARRD
jgi:fatty-acyl-CoA synthase